MRRKSRSMSASCSSVATPFCGPRPKFVYLSFLDDEKPFVPRFLEQKPAREYVRELYDLEMRTLSRPATDEEDYEVSGTAYPFDVWVMTRVIEFIVHENSVEVARTFYRPIMELGPAPRYWVQDFLQALDHHWP